VTEPNSTIPLSCPCGHTWTSNILSGVPLAEWVAHLEMQRCPGCSVPYRVTSQSTTELKS
jgi:hypothetical protein